MKKVVVMFILCMIGSFSFAADSFSFQENQQIDQQAAQYLKKGTTTKTLEEIKKQELLLRELHATLSYSIKSGFLGYGVAKYPTPVLHYAVWFPTLDKSFGASPYTGLNLDAYQQIDELDFVALPGTVFTIVAQVQTGGYTFYQVRTREFGTTSADQGYYIDSRFVDVQKTKPGEREVRLPSQKEIIRRLLAASGTLYVRGGNRYKGIPQLDSFFVSTGIQQSGDLQKAKKMLKGVDCSGLIYQATNGYTPRNTSSLVNFGTGIEIKGLTATGIREKLQPLDLIVWAGHVMIVLDKDRIIESRRAANDTGGTKVRPMMEVLEETMKGKTAANDYYGDPRVDGKKNFVIRRWFQIK